MTNKEVLNQALRHLHYAGAYLKRVDIFSPAVGQGLDSIHKAEKSVLELKESDARKNETVKT